MLTFFIPLAHHHPDRVIVMPLMSSFKLDGGNSPKLYMFFVVHAAGLSSKIISFLAAARNKFANEYPIVFFS